MSFSKFFPWLLTLVASFTGHSTQITSPLISKATSQPKATVSDKSVTTLNVAVLYSAKGHRGFLEGLKTVFEQQHPNISLQFTGYLDAQYKAHVDQWLVSGEMDVVYWQAGERLNTFTRRGLLRPIDKLWQNQDWDRHFSLPIKRAVSVDGNVYALPYAYYTWGMFYHKALFERVGIAPPSNWSELLSMCSVMREQSVVPIMIGTKDPWLPAAWFDYINLRLNGLAFHLSLLRGEQAFDGDKVRNVFIHWKQLIDANCFNNTYQHIDWRAVLPPLFRQMSAMTLLGNFLDGNIPSSYYSNDIGYISFPQINADIPQYEDAPIDVFVIPKASRNTTNAEKFLRFVGQVQVQEQIAQGLGQSSPHALAKPNADSFSRLNASLMASSKGVAQYFDRDLNPAMVAESLTILSQFLSNPDVDTTVLALEKVRQSANKSQ